MSLSCTIPPHLPHTLVGGTSLSVACCASRRHLEGTSYKSLGTADGTVCRWERLSLRLKLVRLGGAAVVAVPVPVVVVLLFILVLRLVHANTGMNRRVRVGASAIGTAMPRGVKDRGLQGTLGSSGSESGWPRWVLIAFNALVNLKAPKRHQPESAAQTPGGLPSAPMSIRMDRALGSRRQSPLAPPSPALVLPLALAAIMGLLPLALPLLPGRVQAAVSAGERQALVDLYLSTNGSGWTGSVAGWDQYANAGVDPCVPSVAKWAGLVCAPTPDRVVYVTHALPTASGTA